MTDPQPDALVDDAPEIRPFTPVEALPLRGVVVLDMSRYLAAPFCATLLADLGANVIKVEALDRSDPGAHTAPVVNGVSLYYMSTTRSKRSIGIDLKSPGGAELFRSLVERADILIENYRRGVPEKLGLDFGSLRVINPRIVVCSVRSFSAESSMHNRPAYDAAVQAYTGIMSVTGQAGGPVARAGVAVADLGTGLYGAVGTLAALTKARSTGEGSHIEISLADTGLAFMAFHLTSYMNTGELIERSGTEHPAMAPLRVFTTADDDLLIMAAKDEEFERLCRFLNRPDLSADPRYQTNNDRVRNRETLHASLAAEFARRPASYWEGELERVAVPCVKVRTAADIAADPDFLRSMYTTVEHPVLGDVKLVRNPILYNGNSMPFQRAAPGWASDTDEVLGEFGFDQEQINKLRESGEIR
jgi:crotonobetainyl-CoA:carnitine CoA-transferase CaiB-like acyl-CoA transferase